MLPRTATFATASRRRAIALWIALLLPAMQALAGWHAVSHLPVHTTGQASIKQEAGVDDPRLAKLQVCELCLTLAGVANAAPAASPSAAIAVRAAPVMAPVVAAPRAGIASVLAYQGRAPPAFQL